jgi:SAM-dependent methyltransferase
VVAGGWDLAGDPKARAGSRQQAGRRPHHCRVGRQPGITSPGDRNDAARLAGEGYSVTAIDWSGEAIEHAHTRFGSTVRFAVADMTQRLPFPDEYFDAVMSNVAMHMFPDRVTRSLFAEVGRLVRPGGLFLFHVNALEDRPLRAQSPLARTPRRMAGAAPCPGPDPASPDR